VAIAVAVFLPVLGGPPIWDDRIVHDVWMRAFTTPTEVFFPPDGIPEWSDVYYRPLVTLSYLADRAVFGLDSFVGHHLTVVVLHALCTLGVARLAQRLLGEPIPATAAAVLFAVHPVHVESVAQISGRSDPLALALMLPALLLALRARDRDSPGSALASAALFGVAVLAKEVAFSVLVLVPALLVWAPGRRIERRLSGVLAAGYASALVGVLGLRFAAGVGSAPLRDQALTEAATRVVRAIGYYAKMAVLPVPQAAFVPMEHTPHVLFGLASIVVLGGLGVVAWRRRGVPWLAWVWFVVALAPALALVLVRASDQPVAERYLYVPSVGVVLALAWLMSRATAETRVSSRVAVGALCLLGAGATVSRGQVYSSREAFWVDTAARAPESALPLYELARVRDEAGDLDAALPLYEAALSRYTDSEGLGLAHNAIGAVHLRQRRPDQAEQAFRSAMEARPAYATPYFNLGMITAVRATRAGTDSERVALLEEAVVLLDGACQRRPTYLKARLNVVKQSMQLVGVHLEAGRVVEGRRVATTYAAPHAAWLVQYDPDGRGGEMGRQALEFLQRTGG
jgi:Tfp pilus assembly protein PilF